MSLRRGDSRVDMQESFLSKSYQTPYCKVHSSGTYGRADTKEVRVDRHEVSFWVDDDKSKNAKGEDVCI
jgi:hypothetical protein